MWSEFTFWIGFALLGVLPGLLVLRAAKVQWPRTEALAAAPGLSLGIISLTAYLAEVLGLPVSLWAVLLLCGGILGALFYLGRYLGKDAPVAALGVTPEPWPCWLVFVLPVFVFLLLEPFRTLFVLPPTLDDGVHHATWFRLIYDRATLNPSEIYAFPVSDQSPVYYPWGFHAWVALCAKLTVLEPIDTYRRLVLLVASCLPLSVYAFAARLLPKGWPSVTAGLFTIIFGWLPFQPFLWGGYPLMAGALCMLPLVRLTIGSLTSNNRIALVSAGMVSLGLLFIHPSQAMGALLIMLLLALHGSFHQTVSWWWSALLAAGVALVGLAFYFGPDLWQPLHQWTIQAQSIGLEAARVRGTQGFTLADDLTLLYFDFFLKRNGVVLVGPVVATAILFGVGLISSVARPAWRTIFGLHLGLLLLVAVATLNTWWTILWYHQLERLWYLQIVSLPLILSLGLLGVVALFGQIPRLWERAVATCYEARLASLSRVLRHQRVVFPALLVIFLAVSYGLRPNLEQRFALATAMMSSDHSLLVDFTWIRDNIPSEEILFNAPGDYGLVYPFTGRQLAFANCMVSKKPSNFIWALKTLHAIGEYDEAKHQRLRAMGIRYVYVGLWPQTSSFIPHPGPEADTTALIGSPGLDMVYISPTSHIYQLRKQLRPAAAKFNLPLDGPPGIFKGFYEVEYDQHTAFRWTDGNGKIFIPVSLTPSLPRCMLTLGWQGLNPVTVAWNGIQLEERYPGVFPLEEPYPGVFPLKSETHLLEINSATFVPCKIDINQQDNRELGVYVKKISLVCGETGQEGGPQNKFELPLGGSDGIVYSGFHEVEVINGVPLRWTTGRGKVQLSARALPVGQECHLSIHYNRRPDVPVEIRWDGETLTQLSSGGYPVPNWPYHLLELTSPTHQISGSRKVGVAVRRVAIRCPQMRTPRASAPR